MLVTLMELDKLIKEIDTKFHDEFDADWSEEGGFTSCSRDRDSILEEDYDIGLTDQEYGYIEAALSTLSTGKY